MRRRSLLLVALLVALVGGPLAVPAQASGLVLDHDASGPLYVGSPLAPGHPRVRCIEVSWTGGTGQHELGLSAAVTGPLAPYLRTRVEVGTGGSFASCSGFSGTQVFDGTLAELGTEHPDHTSQLPAALMDAASGARTFRFTIELADGNSAQGLTADGTFTFGARSVGPTPAPTSPGTTSPAPTSPAPTSPAPTSPAPTSPAPTSPEPTPSSSSPPASSEPTAGTAPVPAADPSAEPTAAPSSPPAPSASATATTAAPAPSEPSPSSTGTPAPVPSGTGTGPSVSVPLTPGGGPDDEEDEGGLVGSFSDLVGGVGGAVTALVEALPAGSVAVAQGAGVTLGMLPVLLLFLLVQHRVDARDPKLALAPDDDDPELPFDDDYRRFGGGWIR